MKRSTTLAASLVTTIAVLAAGCGGDSKSSSSSSSTGSATSAKCPVGAFEKATSPTKVVVWSSYVGKTEQTLEKLATAYNASQSKVQVEVEVQGNSYAELLDKFKKGIPNKQLPAITIGEDKDTQFMIDSGVVVPAQACIDSDKDTRAKTDDILPAVKAAYTVKGVQWPASMNVSTIMLYFNKDDFRAAGLDPNKPPTTLDEIMADAKVLKDKGVKKQPFVMKQDSWFVEQWLTGSRQTMVNKNNGRDGTATAATLDNPVTKTVFDWLQSMKQQDLLNAVPGTDGQINHYLAMLPGGSSSMLLETSAAITTIDGIIEGNLDPASLGLTGATAEAAKNIKVTFDLGVAPDPGLEKPGLGQVGGGAWYITNTGSDAVQSGAWDFIKYFNELKNQVTWTQEGSYLPLLTSVKDDPTLSADWTTSRRGKWLATAYAQVQNLDPKFPGALIGPYTEFRDALRKSIESITLGGVDPASAITSAQNDATKAIKNYADSNF